jgi:hypothetical protein
MRSPTAGIVRSGIVTTWLNASFEMRFRLIGGLTVRFAVSQEQIDHALLLSPWPESLLAFEPVWWRLAKRAQLVAMDLPGFGHSQHSDSLLSPRAMGEFIIVAADAFGLEHPHVVAPAPAPRPRCSPRPGIPAGCGAWSSAAVPPRCRSRSAGWSRTSSRPPTWTGSAVMTRSGSLPPR